MPSLRIGLLLYPGCMPAGLLGFMDLLEAANLRAGRRCFELQWLALEAGPVRCAHGLHMPAAAALEPGACDALLLPGFWTDSPAQVERQLVMQSALIKRLAHLPKDMALWSYCTGVALLAASGRLDGRSATVTWWLADAMRLQFPEVSWECQHASLFQPGIATASGVNGYLPIARALISTHLHPTIYHDINNLMVLPRPQQSASVFQTIPLIAESDTQMRRLQLLVEKIPAHELSIERLATELATSPRTLARRIKAASGHAAAEHIRLLKLNQAGERLLLTSDTVSQISTALGFSDESSFRRSFRQVAGMTPLSYRQKFKY